MAGKVTPAPAEQQPRWTTFDGIDWSARPDPNTATQIQIVVQFKTWEVTKQQGKENLTWNGCLELYWTDRRLDGCPRSNQLPEDIWRPRLAGSLGFSLGDAEKGTKLPTSNDSRKEKTPDGGRISNGKLCLKAIFELGNGGLNLSNHLKRFRAFPYDSTRVDVMVQFRRDANANESNSTDGLDLQFNRPNVSTRIKDGTYQHVDWLATRHCDDLALKGFGYALGSNHVNLWGKAAGTRPCLCLSLHIARTPTFYEQKSILPLYAVLIFGLLCYYTLEPTDLPNRISIMAALFLTVFAIQWIPIERLPRLPFATYLDTVAQCALGGLMMLLVGACSSYKFAAPSSGECAPGAGACPGFKMDRARRVDRLTLIVVIIYVVGYAFLYGLVYQCVSINRECGCFRPWNRGKSLGNTRFAPHAGKAWRLYTTAKWADLHESKFMGEGVRVEASTW